MEFKEAENTEVVGILRSAGFEISEPCYSRPSCFDFAARKGDNFVLMKIQSDVSTLNSRDAQELERISSSISSAILLVSRRGREKPLEDDTVYSRYGISAITPKTLENSVLHNTHPLMQANPGGCYVEIDGEGVTKRRQEMGLSVGKLAQIVGVSRRTLYGYERRMGKASVQTAYNLIWALGIPVAKPVDLYQKRKVRSRCQLLARAGGIIRKNRLLFRIFKRFASCDLTAVDRAPFDFVLTIPEEDILIIGGLAVRQEKDLDRRVEEILSISRIVRARSILLTEGNELAARNISCLKCDEIARSSNPQDLLIKAT
jgi:putative transcriptional regulator